eukprot:TRINITY_DN66371_c0_g1_i1.p1 TRINITY_DN66371_c0_g1~~TRINITY_DN66371_c0_g1_i1.p1  ORF type:complete len:573 (+),score=62.66 TRINITY_DN66371_c0_g1_i1:67-1719(+)
MVDFYGILGVTPAFTAEALRLAFKRQALRQHPDKGGSKEAFHQIMLAYETLSDPHERARYDRRMARKASSHAGNAPLHTADQRKRKRAEVVAATGPGSGAKCSAPDKEGFVGSAGHAHSAERKQGGWDEKSAGRQMQRMERMYSLLGKMQPATRHRLFTMEFSQEERLKLEAWIERKRAGGTDSRGSLGDPVLADDAEDCDDESSATDTCSEKSFPTHEGAIENGDDSSCDEVDEPLAMICDAIPNGGSQSTDRWTRNRSLKVRGIKTELLGYRAFCYISFVKITSHCVPLLPHALELLVSLTDAKQKATHDSCEQGSLADRLKLALNAVFSEHDLCDFYIQLFPRLGFWIGKFHALRTPRLDVGSGLAAISLLHPLYTRTCQKGVSGADLIGQFGMPELQRQWCLFKDAYVDVCERAGWCREQVLARLTKLEANTELLRERACERWNRAAMRKEEICSRRCTRPLEHPESRLERLTLVTLKLWRRGEARATRRAEAHAAKARSQEAAKAKVEAKALRAEREARWRRITRKDITMAEILEGRSFDKQSAS